MSGPVAVIPFGSDMLGEMGNLSAQAKLLKKELRDAEKESQKLAKSVQVAEGSARKLPVFVQSQIKASNARVTQAELQLRDNAKKQARANELRIIRDAEVAQKRAIEKQDQENIRSVKTLRRLSQLNFVRSAIQGQISYADIAAFLADDNTAKKIQNAIKPFVGERVTKTVGSVLGLAGGPAGFVTGIAIDAFRSSWESSSKNEDSARSVAKAFGRGEISHGAFRFASGNAPTGAIKTIFDRDQREDVSKFERVAKYFLEGKQDVAFDYAMEEALKTRMVETGRALTQRETDELSQDVLHQVLRPRAWNASDMGAMIDGIIGRIDKDLENKMVEKMPTALQKYHEDKKDFENFLIGKYGSDALRKKQTTQLFSDFTGSAPVAFNTVATPNTKDEDFSPLMVLGDLPARGFNVAVADVAHEAVDPLSVKIDMRTLSDENQAKYQAWRVAETGRREAVKSSAFTSQQEARLNERRARDEELIRRYSRADYVDEDIKMRFKFVNRDD